MDIWRFLFNFRGRIQRLEFLTLTLASVALGAITLGLFISIPHSALSSVITILLLLAIIVMWFSAVVRRLHDRDKSAWFLLLFFGLPSLLQSIFGSHKYGDTVFILFQGALVQRLTSFAD